MKIRNSSIELLRIISMFMIVISHYCVHNDVIESLLPVGINRYLLEIGVLGNIGVIIFVLITGYFSINAKEPFKIRKLFTLVFETFIYSSLIYLILLLIGKENFSIKMLIKNFMPVTFKMYWFMTCFIVLYIFTPYINKLLNNMNRDDHLKFVCIGLVLFSIIKTCLNQNFYGNELIQFFLFYSIGAFIGKYKNDKLCDKKINKIVFVLATAALLLSVLVFDLLGTKFAVFGSHSTWFFNRTSFVAIAFSVSLFNLFTYKKEFNNKFINTVASSVLGVYLISDNYYIRDIIWNGVSNYVNHWYLIFHMIGLVLLVFIVCIVIDIIRKHTIEKLGLVVFDKFWRE